MYDSFDAEQRITASEGSISAHGVTAVAPDGTVLIRDLTFTCVVRARKSCCTYVLCVPV